MVMSEAEEEGCSAAMVVTREVLKRAEMKYLSECQNSCRNRTETGRITSPPL